MGKQNNNYINWNNGCETCAETTGCSCEVTPVSNCACEVAAANTCGCESKPAKACGCNAAEPYYNGSSNCGCHNHGNETHIIYEACDGYKEVTVTGACQQEMSPGRVLDVNATLLNVCPGRRSALGLTLTELDANGTERPCGFQAVNVPAHHGRCNQDITVDTVRFVLPENECTQQRRHFIVRTQHHYLDAGNIWNNSWGR